VKQFRIRISLVIVLAALMLATMPLAQAAAGAIHRAAVTCVTTSWSMVSTANITDVGGRDQAVAWVYFLVDPQGHFCKKTYVRYDDYVYDPGNVSFTDQMQINGVPYYGANEVYSDNNNHFLFTPQYAVANGAIVSYGIGVRRGNQIVPPSWYYIITPSV
jgi:hypothetical protein